MVVDVRKGKCRAEVFIEDKLMRKEETGIKVEEGYYNTESVGLIRY